MGQWTPPSGSGEVQVYEGDPSIQAEELDQDASFHQVGTLVLSSWPEITAQGKCLFLTAASKVYTDVYA